MFKEFIRSTVIYAGSDIISRVFTFLVVPILTYHLGVANYGLFGLINVTVSLAGGIALLGLSSAFMRLFFDAKTDEERQAVTTTCLVVALVWGFVIIAVVLLFSESIAFVATRSKDNAPFIKVAMLACPLSVLNIICAQALRNELKAFTFALTGFVFAVISSGLLIAGVILWGIAGAVCAMFVSQIIFLPVRLFFIKHLLCRKVDWNIAKGLLSYGVPLVPADIAYWIFMFSDRIIIDKFVGRFEVGYYTLAATITGPMILLHNALGQSWSPIALKMYSEDPENAKIQFGRYCLFFTTAFSALAICLSSFSNELVLIFGGKGFESAAFAIPPLVLSYVCYSMIQVTASGISISRRTYYFAIYSWVIATVNLGLNMILVPKYGMIASAWSTFLSTLLLNVLYAFTSQRYYTIAYPAFRIAGVLALACVGCTIFPYFVREVSLLIIALKIGLLATLGIVMYIWGIPAVMKRLSR